MRNHEYLIQSDEEADQIHKIAEYVNDKLREVEQNTQDLSEKKTVILAALNIAGDYFQALKEQEELQTKIRERTQALILSIDTAMR
jgi:cell division protein ZapA (FtsZ GTPase activity inhibitor)